MATIEQLRRGRRMTQQQLAEELGVSRLTINYWENNQRNISFENAKRVAAFFGIPSEMIQFPSLSYARPNEFYQGSFPKGRFAGYPSPKSA